MNDGTLGWVLGIQDSAKTKHYFKIQNFPLKVTKTHKQTDHYNKYVPGGRHIYIGSQTQNSSKGELYLQRKAPSRALVGTRKHLLGISQTG